MLPRLTFLGHSSVVLELDGVRVVTDPVLRPGIAHLRRVAPSADSGTWADVDVVLISHLHHDHCDLPSLRMLVGAASRPPTIVVPRGAARFLRSRGLDEVVELGAGEAYQRGSLVVTATTAVHDGKREPFGPRAETIGFLLTQRHGDAETSVYFAGDTALFDGMADLHDAIDVALLPVWGWGPNLGPGHLDPDQAARAVELLRPRYALPVHWGTLFPVGLRRLARGVLERPPLEFAAAVGRLDVGTEVLLTAPGSAVAFAP